MNDGNQRWPQRLVHVINGLDVGGAESLLVRLVEAIGKKGVDNRVIVLKQPGSLTETAQQNGATVHSLALEHRPRLKRWSELVNSLRQHRPDVVHTWLYHSDLAGGVVARLWGVPVVWSLHVSCAGTQKITTQGLRVLGSRLSHFVPKRIVCCSEAVREAHQDIGYAANRMSVVPNGVDLERFCPSQERRLRLRGMLGIGPATPVLGMVARFDPAKDLTTFFRALPGLWRQRPETHVVLCGPNMTSENIALASVLSALGLRAHPRLHLLGERSDPEVVYPGLDVFTLTSRTEGLPLALLEAMACGVPFVVPPVGDCASLSRHGGCLVSTGDISGFADAWARTLTQTSAERLAAGEQARARVAQGYNWNTTVRGYGRVYREVMG